MLYYIDEIDQISPEQIDLLLPYVSSERIAYKNRYRFASDQHQSILAFLLLRYALYMEHGMVSMPCLSKDDKGKPFLADYPKIHFNLSHCKTAVACGISAESLGVDVQHYVPYKESLAGFFMTEEERNIARQDPTGREFTRLWTLKESYGKCTGFGICYDMNQTTVLPGKWQQELYCQCYALKTCYLSYTAHEMLEPCKITFAQLYSCMQQLDTEY